MMREGLSFSAVYLKYKGVTREVLTQKMPPKTRPRLSDEDLIPLQLRGSAQYPFA